MQHIYKRSESALAQQVPLLSDLLLEHFDAQDDVEFDNDVAASNIDQLRPISRDNWFLSLDKVKTTNSIKQWLRFSDQLGATHVKVVADLRNSFKQESLVAPQLASLQNSGSLWLCCDKQIDSTT